MALRGYISNISPLWKIEDQRKVLIAAGVGSDKIFVDELTTKERQAHRTACLSARADMLRPTTRKGGERIVIASPAVLAWSAEDFTEALTEAAARNATVRFLDSNLEVGPNAKIPQLHKAAKAFANFNVSRHAKDAVPPNYIDRNTMNVKDPAAVHGVQRDLITQQLEHVPRIDARNPGLTLAIAKDDLEAIAKSLPGLQAGGGKIELDDLLAYLRPRMNGTNVYYNGNPVARRLTTEMEFRWAAQAIVDRIANNGSAQQAESTAKRRAGKPGPKS